MRLLRVSVAALCIAAASAALAQGRGPGGPPPGGPGGGGMNGGPMGPPPPGMAGPPPQSGGRGPSNEASVRPGLQLGPPGVKWWDDKSFVKSLKLRPEQQTRMDAAFEQNRGLLVSRLQTLRQAESQMEELSGSSSPDEAALFAEIDRVAQARAELEKATAHMLLQIRKQMDPDQIARLEKRR